MKNQSIPYLEKLFIRAVVAPAVKSMPLDKATAIFVGEGQKILDLCAGFDESRMTARKKIPRLPGIEAISMDWSLAMVIEHLLIVARGGKPLIQQLSQGIVPDVVVSTANVKPKGALTGAEARAQFQQLLRDWPAWFDGKELQNSPNVKLAHPWFGPMNAAQWYKFLSVHHRVHRRQVEKLAALRDAS